MVGDTDPHVRMQLAYALGDWPDPRAGAALGELAATAAGDRYLTAAVLSSVTKDNLEAVVVAALRRTPAPRLVEELLLLADAFGQPRATRTLLDTVSAAKAGRYAPWQFGAMAGLLDGLERRNSSLPRLANDGDAATKQALGRLAGLFAAARVIAADTSASPADRARAVPLLGRGLTERDADLDRLTALLVPQTPAEVQTASVATLGRQRTSAVPARLLRGWGGYGPTLRAQVLEALSRRSDWLRAALDAVERGTVPAAEVDAARREQWLKSKDATVRGRAERLFGGAANPDRQKVIDAYQSVLTLKGDATRGQPLYVKHCATCHRLGATGGEVGPDLAALAGKPTDYLLTAILDPSRAVEARYVAYVAHLKDGRTLTGVLADESGNRVTLIGIDGKPQVVSRTALESLSSTGKSAMPDGLEKDLDPAALADLLAYIRAAPK
jgi:putative heme-binding domain-containing protein